MDASETSAAYICISEDVISKVRSELVVNGELEESVLSELQAIWKRKMIQAGVVNGPTEISFASILTPTPLQSPDQHPLPGFAESGIDIDAQPPRLFSPSTDFVMSIKNERDGSNDGDTVSNALNDEDDELLNEDDDVEEEDAIAIDEEFPDLVMCQFDNVTKRKTKKSTWDCNLKAGVMQINGRNILFSKAKGEFNF